MSSRGKRGLFDLSIRIGSPDKPQLKIMQKASRFFHAILGTNGKDNSIIHSITTNIKKGVNKMKKFMMFLCLAFIVGYSNGQTIVVSLADEIIEGTNYFCTDTLIIHGDSTCQWVYYYRPDGAFVEVHSYELVVTESENQG